MSDASPDELDELLGRRARAREQAELDARAPEWEAVAKGELELDDAIAARRDAGDDDVEHVAAYFRPFDAGETAALVDGLLAGLGDEPGAPAGEDFTAEDNVIVIPRAQPEAELGEAAKSIPIEAHDPGTSRSWWIPGGMLAAAAAAIAVWWIWPPSSDIRGTGDGPRIAQRDPLPSYALETDGGLKQLRGDGDGDGDSGQRLRYRRASDFQWVLRPSVVASGAIDVRGFAFVDGGSAGLPLALDAMAEIADTGAIRIHGAVAQLGLEPGRYTIALVVGRPDALPVQAAAVAEPSDDWTVQRIDLEILD